MREAVSIVEMTIDLPRRRRGRACIVLTRDAGEQKAWASKLASQANAKHIDLLDRFVDDEALGTKISMFGVNDLFTMLQREKDKHVLVVTGLEFLRASWLGQSSAMEDFAKRLEFWEQSPALLFVTQYDAFLANRNFDQRFQYTYVVNQQDTLAL